MRLLFKPTSRYAGISDNGLEVFWMIGAGAGIREIADKLCRSSKTIEAHREHIKCKLGLKSCAQLVRYAMLNSPENQPRIAHPILAPQPANNRRPVDWMEYHPLVGRGV